MKKISILSALMVFFTAITFIACDTEPVDPVLLDNIGETPGETTGSLTVNFSGQNFVASQVSGLYNEGLLSVSGIRVNGSNIETLSFVVASPVEGQTYTGDQGALFTYSPSMNMYQYINIDSELELSGSLTITDIDTVNHTVSGTFSFTGWWSNEDEDVAPIEFTNGSFTNVSYTGGTPPETSDDVLTAVLDGTNFPVANVAVAVADGGLGETISINGLDVNQNKVVVSMKASLNPGTYNITGNMLDDVVGGRYTTTSPEAMYMATTGSVTITSKTETRIAGTFTFTATSGEETVTVTQGTFDVDYSF